MNVLFVNTSEKTGWVLEDSDYGRLSEASRKKVLERYSEENVAGQYVRLYQSLSNRIM